MITITHFVNINTAGWIGAPELVIIAVIAILFIIPLVALIDILKSQFASNDKLIWILIVLFLPLIGSILYFIIGKKKKQ